MIARIAPVVVALAVASALYACTPPASEGSQIGAVSADRDDDKGSSDDSESASSGKNTGAASADGGAPAQTEGDGGTGGDKGTGEDPPPGDGTCVSTCVASLEAKCGGDEFFCEEVCEFNGAAFVDCLVAAPSCDKNAWSTCETQNPPPSGNGGGGGGKGGGK